MSKGLPYEGIMALDEKAIAENFPHGAREFPKNRWQPADTPEAAVKSLDKLLADKRKRREQPRYLRQSYSRDNYTHIPGQAVGKDKQGRGAPEEAVPADVQKQITAEAHERDDARKAPLHERLKRLEQHAQPHQLESLERRIKGLERSLHDKAA